MNYTDVFENVYPYNVIKAVYDVRFGTGYDIVDLFLVDACAFMAGIESHLTPREYECIKLRFISGLTYDGIASSIHRTRARARQIVQKGLRKLYYHIQKKYRLIPINEYNKVHAELEELIAENKFLRSEIIKKYGENFEMPDVISDDFDIKIDALDLSTRSYNALTRAGIKTIKDLKSKSAEDMMSIRNFGKKSLEEVVCKAREFGITFKSEYTTVQG